MGYYPRSIRGHIGILVVLDHFSKFPFLQPVPETIVSDNGTQFKPNKFNELLQQYGVSHVYTEVKEFWAESFWFWMRGNVVELVFVYG